MDKLRTIAILTDPRNKKHLVKLKDKGQFHSDKGFIWHTDIMEVEEGGIIYSSKHVAYRVFTPTYIEYIMNIKRQAQIIYPKDSAVMVMWADICQHHKVLEAGFGQGGLTIHLLKSLGENGHLTTYEKREDFAMQATNIVHEYFGDTYPVDRRHTVVLGDIYEKVDGVYDRIVLDLPEAWHVIKHTDKCLVEGGVIVTYLPSVSQVMEYVRTLNETGHFTDIETFELILRPWKVDVSSDKNSVRPEMWMYNHSAFIIKARKTSSASRTTFVPEKVVRVEPAIEQNEHSEENHDADNSSNDEHNDNHNEHN